MIETLTFSYKNTLDIMHRMDCFCDLLGMICRGMNESVPLEGALESAVDLITCICRDFQADIDCAELAEEKKEAS